MKQMAIKIYKLMQKNVATRKLTTVSLLGLSFIVIGFSGVFEKSWYRLQKVTYGDIRDKLPLLAHYILVGRKKGYTPHPLFVAQYFDPTGWSTSKADPLARYLLQKKHWNTPTHPLFDGSRFDIENRTGNPLRYFVKVSNNSTELPVDHAHGEYEHVPVKWSRVRKDMFLNQKEWLRQEDLRHTNKPTTKYDHNKEETFIQKWSNAELPNVGKGLPLVSIIMPVWNREALVGAAIESVQAQKIDNWELLIADDGSTDDTIKVINSYCKADPRVKLLRQDHGGVCRARNAALREAMGKWVAFLDSDNTWTPDFLRTSIAAMSGMKIEAAYTSVKMNEANGARYRINEPNNELLKISNFIDLNVFIVEKKILDKVGFFNEELRRAVDHDLILRVAAHVKLQYLPLVGVNYTNHDDVQRISNTELLAWGGVVKNLNVINWKNVANGRRKDTISIIFALKEDPFAIARTFSSFLEHTKITPNMEIVLVDSSSTPSVSSVASGLAGLHENITFMRSPESHDLALGSNIGFAKSKGEKIVFVQTSMSFEKGWLEPIVQSLKQDNTQLVGPIQLAPNRTIHSAGVLFPSPSNTAIKLNFLQDHPDVDAKQLDSSSVVDAIHDGLVAVKADCFAEMKGFSPLFDNGLETTDLSLRIAKKHKNSVRIASGSRCVNYNRNKGWNNKNYQTFYDRWTGRLDPSHDKALWKKVGFEVVSYVPESMRLTAPGFLRPLLKRIDTSKLRWAIKVPAPADRRRFAWGDTYFTKALAEGLEELGQSVALDFIGAHDRPTSYLDDVVLSLRGLADIAPHPGKLNLLWIYSHPEKVTVSEMKLFDKVYAAGTTWAKDTTQKTGISVSPLLQCTDHRIFKPQNTYDKEYKDTYLFVVNSRNVFRPIVKDALSAGIDISVYGGGWEQFIDRKYIKRKLLANNDLPKAYGSAAVVFNDHWEGMRKMGFLSNRLFDATATGARVVSDSAEGIAEVFDGSVYQYKTVEDLRALNDLDSVFMSREARLAVAEKVRRDHSFFARAKQLHSDVEKIIEEKNSR